MRILFFSVILFALCFLESAQIELSSSPVKRDEDEMSRVLILEKILSDWKQYNLFLVDSFEGSRPWEIYRSVSFLNEIRFNSQIPENSAFSKEREFYPTLSTTNDYRSMMVQTFFRKSETLTFRNSSERKNQITNRNSYSNFFLDVCLFPKRKIRISSPPV